MPSDAVERFTAAAAALGITPEVLRFTAETRTAAQAADALGCDIAQIVKSLVFDAEGEIVLVLTSGSNRVDEQKVAAALGVESLGKADADAARQATGFAIGGIPPFGHGTRLRAVLDEHLLTFGRVWAAAGAPDAVFELDPKALVDLAGAQPADIAVD